MNKIQRYFTPLFGGGSPHYRLDKKKHILPLKIKSFGRKTCKFKVRKEMVIHEIDHKTLVIPVTVATLSDVFF